jgi:hypothetical protein
MSKVRAPRKPKGEDLAVTVANQDKQITVLIARCEELSALRDQYKSDRDVARAEISRLKQAMETQKSDRQSMIHVLDRLRGWQDCAREILHGGQIQTGRT